MTCPNHPHTHKTEDGFVVKCYHQCKSVLWSVPFWIGLTIGYPLEHTLWEHVPPFKQINEFIQGLFE